jgi:dolichol kinase
LAVWSGGALTPDGGRRLLHAATAAVAFVGLVSPSALRLTAAYIAVTAVLLEALRLRVPAVGRGLSALVPVYRDHERERPSGAMWLALGYAVAAWVPHPAAALAGILAGGLADPAGALVGSRYGGGARKSLAGSVTVGMVALLAALVTGLPRAAAVGAALAATVVERWPGPCDDNLLVAPATALAAFLLA